QKIAVPNNTWPGLVLMQSELSAQLMSDLLVKYFDTPSVWDTTDLTEEFAGANLADRARASLAVAVLRNTPGNVGGIVTNMARDLNSGGWEGTGLMPDDAFLQHNDFPSGSTYHSGFVASQAVRWYAGSYGIVYANDLGDMLPWLHGTFLAFSSASESQ